MREARAGQAGVCQKSVVFWLSRPRGELFLDSDGFDGISSLEIVPFESEKCLVSSSSGA